MSIEETSTPPRRSSVKVPSDSSHSRVLYTQNKSLYSTPHYRAAIMCFSSYLWTETGWQRSSHLQPRKLEKKDEKRGLRYDIASLLCHFLFPGCSVSWGGLQTSSNLPYLLKSLRICCKTERRNLTTPQPQLNTNLSDSIPWKKVSSPILWQHFHSRWYLDSVPGNQLWAMTALSAGGRSLPDA